MTGRALKRKDLIPLTALGLSVVNAALVVIFEVLPSQDLPNHLAIVATLARGDESEWWSAHFIDRLELAPYSGFYWLGTALASIFSPALGGRLALAIGLAALPLSLWYAAAAVHSRGATSALLAVPFIFADSYLVGFAPFILSLPFAFVALGAALRLAEADEWRWRYWLVASVAAAIGLLCHPLGAALASAFILVAAAWRARHRWQFAWTASAATLPLILLALFARGHVTSGGNDYLTLGFKLAYLLRTPVWLADASRGWIWLVLMLTAAAFCAAVASWPRLRTIGALRLSRSSWLWPILAAFAVYFFAPFRVGQAIWFDLRLAAVPWLLLAIPMGHALARRRAGRVAAVSFAIVATLAAADVHRRFASEARPLEEIIETLPRNQRVLSLVYAGTSEVFSPFYKREDHIGVYFPYAHAVSYYHTAKGGISPLMTFHASLPWIPLELRSREYRDDFWITDAHFPDRPASQLARIHQRFDFVLTRGARDSQRRQIERFAELVATADEFALYHLRRR